MKNKKIASILAALMVAASLSACGGAATAESSSAPAPAPAESSSEASSTTPTESSSAPADAAEEEIRLGLLEKSIVEDIMGDSLFAPAVDTNAFNLGRYASLNTMLLELEAGKLNVIGLPYSVCQYITASNSELKIANSGEFMSNNFHMGSRAEDAKLNKELSDAIDSLKADGTIDKLAAEFMGDNMVNPAPVELVKKEGGETHKVAITGDLPPMDYVAADGTPAGFNVALLNAISEKTGCNFEIVQIEANARLTALQSGNVDFLFWVHAISMDGSSPSTEGLLLTSSYYTDNLGMISYSQDILDAMVKTFKENIGN